VTLTRIFDLVLGPTILILPKARNPAHILGHVDLHLVKGGGVKLVNVHDLWGYSCLKSVYFPRQLTQDVLDFLQIACPVEPRPLSAWREMPLVWAMSPSLPPNVNLRRDVGRTNRRAY
jgi:hypothetical protein